MKRIIRCVCFAVVFMVCFLSITDVMRNKDDATSYAPFYQEDEQYDVLFVGTSVTNCGISPLDLWNDYGIVSYNIANSGQGIANSYYALKDALRVQKPQLVVMDVSYIARDSSTGMIHTLFDNMPMGQAKWQGVRDLAPESEWIDYFVPLLYYHQRWEELSAKDFDRIVSLNRGGAVMKQSYDKEGKVFDTSVFSEGMVIVPEDEKSPMDEKRQEYIGRITQLCRDNDVDILFVNYPGYAVGETNHGDGEELQRLWNGFADVARENHADYMNCLHMIDEIEFDFATDLADWRHLNINGNKKITHYIGSYIQEQYNIPDRRNETELQHWNEDYLTWQEYVRGLEAGK